MLWGLSTYSASNRMLEAPDFIGMFMRELEDGQHLRPERLPFFTRAFFHLPEELSAEVREAGFVGAEILAVEEPDWIVPQIDALWAEERSRQAILTTVRAVERQLALMGVSPHLLAVARKENLPQRISLRGGSLGRRLRRWARGKPRRESGNMALIPNPLPPDLPWTLPLV